MKRKQQKKAKYAGIKQRKAKACTKLSDNLCSVSTAEEAHKLIQGFETQNTVKFPATWQAKWAVDQI